MADTSSIKSKGGSQKRRPYSLPASATPSPSRSKQKGGGQPRRGKKRKLKKSVRRGCLGIVLAILLFAGLTIYECCRPTLVAEMPTLAVEPDSVDIMMAERLADGVRHAMHIDTTQLALCVYDLTRGCYVYQYHGHQLLPPASCMKLLTAIGALHHLGSDHHYKSTLSRQGRVEGGTLHGDLLLEMDDDPLILDFRSFTTAIKQQGINAVTGSVVLSLARTDTLRQHHTAKPWDIPYHKVPLLMKGAERIQRELATALRKEGIEAPITLREPRSTEKTESEEKTEDTEHSESTKDAESAETQAPVLIHEERTPLLAVLDPMVIHSSNIKAECVLHHILHTPSPFSPEAFIRDEMQYLTPDSFVINDGSGLSPANRLTADFLTQLMVYAYRDEAIRHILISEALATPGHPTRHGSLLTRMRQPIFHNRIFCKTGTIVTIGASSLTGYAHCDDDRWYAFSIVGNNSPVYDSRIFQDQICRILVTSKR